MIKFLKNIIDNIRAMIAVSIIITALLVILAEVLVGGVYAIVCVIISGVGFFVFCIPVIILTCLALITCPPDLMKKILEKVKEET